MSAYFQKMEKLDDVAMPLHVGQAPTDFIQKLFRLVSQPESHHLARWSENGDSFLITDPHDFAKELLPKHFKHNNFQSFIRQLNKYGFSKVKRTTDDKIWEFKHESFCRDHVTLLKDIRRKAAVTRRVSVNTFEAKGLDNLNNKDSPSIKLEPNKNPQLNYLNPNTHLEAIINNLQERITQLENKTEQPYNNVEMKYNRLMKEVENLTKSMTAQDTLMQSIVQCIISQEKALMLFVDNQWRQDFNPPMPNAIQVQNPIDPMQSTINTMDNSNQFPPQAPYLSANIQRLVNNYKQASKMTGTVLNNFTEAAQDYYNHVNFGNPNTSLPQSNMNFNNGNNFSNPNTLNNQSSNFNYQQQQQQQQKQQQQHHILTNSNNDSIQQKQATVNQRMMLKRKAINEKRAKVDNSSQNLAWTWIVPPNVLLVDDDPTCQAIYAKSLQILGCSYDIAADGSEAVSKMKTRKYDMVLMDIWMPEMDGLSATKLIREFDPATPIIAITGDYRESDREFYLEQGINEVLGKPLKVKELGPIMQKHWLKFCINRDAETMQSSMQPSNETNGLQNPYSISGNATEATTCIQQIQSSAQTQSQIQANGLQQGTMSNMSEGMNFNTNTTFYSTTMPSSNFSTSLGNNTYYQSNSNNQ